MSSKNVNSFSTIDTVNTYSNSSLLGIVSGNLTRLTSGNLVLNKVNASNLIYNTGNQIISGVKTFANDLSINNNLFFISQPSGYISGLNYDGNYNGGIHIGRTRLTQSTLGLIEFTLNKLIL